MRTAPSVNPRPTRLDAEDKDEERTIRRPIVRAAQQRAACAYTTRVTRSVEKVDPRLAAIARGEIDPERNHANSQLPPTVPPSPSVIPLTDEDLIDVDEDWLAMGIEPDPFPTKNDLPAVAANGLETGPVDDARPVLSRRSACGAPGNFTDVVETPRGCRFTCS